jgi:hypothetical protein
VKSKVNQVKGKASQGWDKLENIFENRVAKTLQKLDVPTSEEITALLKKVELLATEVSKLTGNYVADVKDATKKAVAEAKPAVKKVAKKTTKKVSTKVTKES